MMKTFTEAFMAAKTYTLPQIVHLGCSKVQYTGPGLVPSRSVVYTTHLKPVIIEATSLTFLPSTKYKTSNEQPSPSRSVVCLIIYDMHTSINRRSKWRWTMVALHKRIRLVPNTKSANAEALGLSYWLAPSNSPRTATTTNTRKETPVSIHDPQALGHVPRYLSLVFATAHFVFLVK